jgi:hypothetical protein
MSETESELLTALHRRWIESRDPADGDRFAFMVQHLRRKDEKERFPAFRK